MNTGPAPPLPDSFVGTRLAVHALAEHVLCAVRYAAAGRIGLLPAADGIVTPPFDRRTVGLHGLDLVDRNEGGERRARVTTLGAAADHFGSTTFGGSPGDAEHDQPYLYVLPPVPVPGGDRSFWNEPFGAAVSYDRVGSSRDAVAFFADAASRIRSVPAPEDRR